VGFEKTLPGFEQHPPVKCSVFPPLFGAERYQSFEFAFTNVGYHYLKVDLFHIEFCNDSVTHLRFNFFVISETFAANVLFSGPNRWKSLRAKSGL
jgi:hypothetical protein